MSSGDVDDEAPLAAAPAPPMTSSGVAAAPAGVPAPAPKLSGPSAAAKAARAQGAAIFDGLWMLGAEEEEEEEEEEAEGDEDDLSAAAASKDLADADVVAESAAAGAAPSALEQAAAGDGAGGGAAAAAAADGAAEADHLDTLLGAAVAGRVVGCLLVVGPRSPSRKQFACGASALQCRHALPAHSSPPQATPLFEPPFPKRTLSRTPARLSPQPLARPPPAPRPPPPPPRPPPSAAAATSSLRCVAASTTSRGRGGR
jgi:hypothetical protein